MTRLIVVGGFLGAGKTTSILALARRLLEKNKKIGIVTNDQGSALVDTAYLQSQGLSVLEVTGGCFCCNFDEFAAKLNQMSAEQYPDYILAEPVGSCTDLIATIMKPIGRGLAGQFALAPLSIVVDPKRLRRVIAEQESLFPNEINYLFKKQIEEADIIVLNKADTVNAQELKAMEAYLRAHYGGSEVLAISAREEKGIDEWLERLALLPAGGFGHPLDIEYDVYARAEAALGWLNTTCTVKLGRAMPDANAFLSGLAGRMKQRLSAGGHEIAHMKLYMISKNDFCKLSCVGIDEEIVFDKRMSVDCDEASLVINIRAGIDPPRLQALTEASLADTVAEYGASMDGVRTECFAPSYPRPRHRMAD